MVVFFAWASIVLGTIVFLISISSVILKNRAEVGAEMRFLKLADRAPDYFKNGLVKGDLAEIPLRYVQAYEASVADGYALSKRMKVCRGLMMIISVFIILSGIVLLRFQIKQ